MILAAIILIGNVWIANEYVRLSKFSKTMDKEIKRVYAARRAGNYDEKYPDVDMSYSNLKWYEPFNYNFKSMIVYENVY